MFKLNTNFICNLPIYSGDYFIYLFLLLFQMIPYFNILYNFWNITKLLTSKILFIMQWYYSGISWITLWYLPKDQIDYHVTCLACILVKQEHEEHNRELCNHFTCNLISHFELSIFYCGMQHLCSKSGLFMKKHLNLKF